MASSSHAITGKDQRGDQEFEEEDEEDLSVERVASAIQILAEQVLCEREAYVKRRVLANKERLSCYIGNFLKLDEERKRIWEYNESSSFFSLCLKSHQTYGALNGSGESSGENDGRLATLESNGADKPISIIFGFQTGGKTTVRSVKLPKVENVPPYTTWIYLDRNQRMTEDQSVVGRRRIYYDSFDNETRIASDSEEEDTGDDDDKDEPTHDFSKAEDSLIWMSVRELGKKAVVLTELSEVLEISTEEIEARSDILRVSYKNEETELLLLNSGGDSGSGISSQSRRVIPTAELARGSLNETSNGASRALVLFHPGKETVNEESEVQATLENGKRSRSPETDEDDKNEPKDLLTAMDSFDNLFCRRCLVFDCRLHGCSQAIVHPSERQQPWSGAEEAMSSPCGKDCYLLTDPNYITKLRLGLAAPPQPDVDGTGVEPSECPEQKPITTNTQDDDMGASARFAKRSRTSSRERSCSSETHVLASSTILESAAGQQPARIGLVTADPPKVVLKEKKLDKRPSATRRSLSRRVKQNYPRRDTACLLKPQLSQGESIISIDSDSQDFPKDATPPLKEEESSHQEAFKGKEVVQGKLSSKGSWTANDGDIECNDPGEDDTSREGETADEKFAVVPVPEVLCYKEGQDGAAGDRAKMEVGVGWSEMEMGLYEKGLQIFGRNSCLIARNLLQDCKTCAEVAKYSLELDAAGPDGVRRIADSLDIEAASRARLYGVRRKKGARKLKYTFRSVVHPLLRKRMTNGKDQTCRQYTPCNCLYTCGKQCPCLLNGTCCEKYCGCSKSCKNRFRGCHCAKSNCCSRQCPCFAAGRECDPDVCRNCWVGCGDGTVDGPPPRGDNYSCHNMKLMLKQQQRVLLGRSAVAGWGAFLKDALIAHLHCKDEHEMRFFGSFNRLLWIFDSHHTNCHVSHSQHPLSVQEHENPVAKHEYLGEYTGELISHREADKRGKIYDLLNSSFLFNLNDQYVLDACRKGDKLKFANHSLQPNCYAKVVMVSGDHRVGIFAKERITAGEELFYDYQYEPDRAPIWARKPDDPNRKRDDTPSTTRRAQKAA